MQYEWPSVLLALGLSVSCLAVAYGPADARGGDDTVCQVKTRYGRLEGTVDTATGIRSFKGVPFAAPPVGARRWQPPYPVEKWRGVRLAHNFGPRAMQRPLFGDMVFRSSGMSEDCLYLNIWTPAWSPQVKARQPKSRKGKLPVLVYFFGGGYVAGDSSEGRYDGASMANQGIVAVTVNYRLGAFGFLAHPELTKESPHRASGNYGLLDQHAALEWVHENIAAFGGDPGRVTIAGESAGSLSVSAQMASPLSKGLMAGAIGESGSLLATLVPAPLPAAEAAGVRFASGLGLGPSPSLAALRALPAEKLLQARANAGDPWCIPTVDGYFFPKAPLAIYAAGEQAHVPLLAGVNSAEAGAAGVLGRDQPTVENYRRALQRLYRAQADAVFQLYPATNEAEVTDVAQALASDRFISYGTWKWVDLATKTGGQPTYYYYFARPRPPLKSQVGNAAGPPGPRSGGAVHSAEIEYVLGNLGYNQVYAWNADDYQISRVMQQYFANFIKSANPNGPGVPPWPMFASGQRLVLDVNTHAESLDKLRARYEFFNQLTANP